MRLRVQLQRLRLGYDAAQSLCKPADLLRAENDDDQRNDAGNHNQPL